MDGEVGSSVKRPGSQDFLLHEGSDGAAQDETKASGVSNGGFEEQDDSGRPVGWIFPLVLEQSGYRVRVETDNPLIGEKCAKSKRSRSGATSEPFCAT